MIEIIVKEHLESRQDAPVYFEFPKDAPDRFLVLKKEGNPRENLVSSALIIVDSYGPNLLAAARLNETVKKDVDINGEERPPAVHHRGYTDKKGKQMDVWQELH